MQLDTTFDKCVHRPVAARLARFLAKTPLTPNQVTVISLLPAGWAAWHFIHGTWTHTLSALGLFYLWAVLDHTDGELARLTGRTSEFGHQLDNWCDHIASLVMLAGIFKGLLPYWNEFDQTRLTAWFVPAAAIHVLSLIFLGRSRESCHTPGPKRQWLDCMTGRETFYILIVWTALAQFFRTTYLYSSVMAVLIVALITMSLVFFGEGIRLRYNSAHD